MMFAEKFFEPIEILSPSNDLMSDSGPASSPVRTGPAAVPKPQPESNNPRQARTAVTETDVCRRRDITRSEEHTSELQSLMRNSYAVFCLKKKNTTTPTPTTHN